MNMNQLIGGTKWTLRFILYVMMDILEKEHIAGDAWQMDNGKETVKNAVI